MHHFRLRRFGRTLFTITGIALLIIFGARAASQAGSLAAVGGEVKKAIASANEGLGKFAGLTDLSAPHNARLADMAMVEPVAADSPPATAPDPQPMQTHASPESKLGVDTGAGPASDDNADDKPAVTPDRQNNRTATDQPTDGAAPENTTSTAPKTEDVK
jgi:hypothetical protein